MKHLNEKNLSNIFFYVHHHGAGHIARAEHFIAKLKESYSVVIIYSDLKVKIALKKISNQLVFERLPSKWLGSGYSERNYSAAFEGIEYSDAPLQRSITFNLLAQQYRPVLFISDVSAELTIMARSIGLPVIMQRHSGDISCDPTQVFAYECATKLYAPFPKQLEAPNYNYINKTKYLGFISKYSNSDFQKSDDNHITLLISDTERASCIARTLIKYTDKVEVIGCSGEPIKGVTYKGVVDNIADTISSSIVLSSCGNNAVSELLSLGKKLIVIPESRPYQEQDEKAHMLSKNNLAVYLPYAAFLNSDDTQIENALLDVRMIQNNNAEIFNNAKQFASEFIALVEEVALES